MKTYYSLIVSFLLSCIFLFALPLYVYATPPNKYIDKLEERELTVNLYIISIAVESQRLKGIEFIWIPQSLESQCIGQSYKSCRDLDRDKRMKQIAEKNNIATQLKDKLFKKYPRRLLTNWVSEGDARVFPENKKILEQLSRIDFIKALLSQRNGEQHFDFIAKEKAIRARVHWELWPNGENFRVIEIIRE